jgi:hypothetical protein
MLGCCSAIIYPLIKWLDRREPSRASEFLSLISSCSQTWELIGLNSDSRHSPIHILNDDVLLNIFHLYRLAEPDEYQDGIVTVIAWRRQRWWYKLAHVS